MSSSANSIGGENMEEDQQPKFTCEKPFICWRGRNSSTNRVLGVVKGRISGKLPSVVVGGE